MADEAEVKLRPGGDAARLLDALLVWQREESAAVRPLSCVLREAKRPDGVSNIGARLRPFGDTLALIIRDDSAIAGWSAHLSLSEAERLRVFLNEVMG